MKFDNLDFAFRWFQVQISTLSLCNIGKLYNISESQFFASKNGAMVFHKIVV